jgi:hypothetical protein
MIKETSSHKPGRFCKQEFSYLGVGLDFRQPAYRREVFLRFYEFHLKYKAHPGAVYYMMPYISEKLNFSTEDKLWFAYINGCSQNILTTYTIFKEFPSLKDLDIDNFNLWFREHYTKLGWDTDRRYVKNSFDKCILDYKKIIGDKTQEDFFNSLANTTDEFENFRNVWDKVINDFYLFGRLSTFSYLEYLRIMGLNIDCDQLFLYDMDGSKSHRNGLCKVLGRDDLDWHDKLNPNFEGYTKDIIEWLIQEGETLLNEAKDRFKKASFYRDVSYFTLESTLCCYKSWHRKNRRYPNVYNDMFHDRIKYAESKWEEFDKFNIFWEARKELLPEYLRLEANPLDPGVKAEKQNHYRDTGQVIMMDDEWPCFKNDFNDRYYRSRGIEDFI